MINNFKNSASREYWALHGVISQKKILFKTTAVKTSNPTKEYKTAKPGRPCSWECYEKN
jgi:hypothetical protein